MAADADPARKSIGARRNPDSAGAILEAAEAVLVEAGYAGFSIEAVARRARAGKPPSIAGGRARPPCCSKSTSARNASMFPNGRLEEDLVGFVKNLFSHWRETSSGSVFRSLIAEAQSDKGRRRGTCRLYAGPAVPYRRYPRTRQGKGRNRRRHRFGCCRRPDRFLRLEASVDQQARRGRGNDSQGGRLRDARNRSATRFNSQLSNSALPLVVVHHECRHPRLVPRICRHHHKKLNIMAIIQKPGRSSGQARG